MMSTALNWRPFLWSLGHKPNILLSTSCRLEIHRLSYAYTLTSSYPCKLVLKLIFLLCHHRLPVFQISLKCNHYSSVLRSAYRILPSPSLPFNPHVYLCVYYFSSIHILVMHTLSTGVPQLPLRYD